MRTLGNYSCAFLHVARLVRRMDAKCKRINAGLTVFDPRATFPNISRAVVVTCGLSIPAMAAPPPGADTDSVIAHWVHQLYTPEGTLCCGVSDCRPTAFRIVDEQPVVWIGKDEYGETAPDQWVPVPDDLIENTRAPGPPPDGRVWACWYNSKLRCIVLGSGS